MVIRRKSGMQSQKQELAQRHRVIPRRIVLAALAGIGTFMATGRYFVPSVEDFREDVRVGSDESYQDWYERSFKVTAGKTFVHPAFHMNNHSPTPVEMSDLNGEIIEKIRMGGVPYQLVWRSFTKDTRFSVLDVSDSVMREYERRSKESIREFFEFIGMGAEVPRVSFHRAGPHTELRLPNKGEVPMYFVADIADLVRGEFDLVVGDAKEEHERTIIYPMLGRADSYGVYDLDYGDRVYKLRKFVQEPILVSPGNLAIDCYTSPPAEVLHFVLRDVRIRGGLKDRNDYLLRQTDAQGNVRIDDTDIYRIGNDWSEFEEGVVHAALDVFLERNNGRLGFPQRDIDRYFEHNPQAYHLVPRIRDHMRRNSVPEFFERYREDGRRLIEGITGR